MLQINWQRQQLSVTWSCCILFTKFIQQILMYSMNVHRSLAQICAFIFDLSSEIDQSAVRKWKAVKNVRGFFAINCENFTIRLREREREKKSANFRMIPIACIRAAFCDWIFYRGCINSGGNWWSAMQTILRKKIFLVQQKIVKFFSRV